MMRRALPAGTVTMLFTDIEGSTRLLHALGDEYGSLLADHHRILREVWAAHGGIEIATDGDAFFVAFSDAGQALSAAVQAQRSLRAHRFPGGRPVRVRMAVHTGTPQILDGNYWGPDVHYAARLAAAAHGGQILSSASTRGLVEGHAFESLGEHALKDFTTPRELFHVIVDGVEARAFPPPRTLERIRTNLPPADSSLVGRARELAELTQALSDRRLVTVAGPGGSGKTRLALAAAHALLEQFDGVWFVALDQISDAAEVFAAAAQTLGLPQQPGVDDFDRVVAHVRERATLMVLDNVEHVVASAPQIARLAAAGPAVRVLMTSQVPLRVAGEHVLRLGPLELPTGEEPDETTLAAVPAVALLVQRARQAGSSFAVGRDDAEVIVTLTRQLEGMPLAIELAAARLDLLGPAGLSARLDRGLDALGRGGRDLPPRQRGLRAILEWTCGLLDDGARHLLARLSVFAAGFPPGLAEAAFGDCLDDLDVLLEASLLTRDADGRLSLRPPVRRFAGELLAADGGEAEANAAAADALAALAEPFERRWLALEAEGRRTVNPEAANIGAALDWARDRDPRRHARLAAATGWWATRSGRWVGAAEHLRLALERTEDPILRARCLQAVGALGVNTADPAGCVRAADAWRDLGDADGEFFSAVYAVNLYGHAEQAAAGEALLRRAQAIADRAPADPDLQWPLAAVRAEALYQAGDHAAARAMVEPWLAGAPTNSARQFWVATRLADIALDEGGYAEALELYGVCIRCLDSMLMPSGQVVQAITVIIALIRLGRRADAAVTLAVCDLAGAEIGWRPVGHLDVLLAQARDELTAAERAAGRRRADELGMERGLAWVGALARGEL